jgi:HD-GYP domain-containing protein (c-di-GMP phosphodiesterase class II)
LENIDLLRPVQLDPALIGQPLPYDLYSESGVLLAGAGMYLADETHFHKLAARTLYRHAEAENDSIQPLQRLREIATYTAKLLTGPQTENSAAELHLLAQAFIALFRIDPDACLGYPRLAPVASPGLNHDLHALFISILLADQLDFTEQQTESLAAAALTMNIANMGLHDRHLCGAMSSADQMAMRAHPGDSADILEQSGVTDPVWLDSVRQHHENMDGSGFPDSLTAARISLAARILHVADIYCDKLAGRHYRPPKSLRQAFKEWFGGERAQLDTQIVNLLLRRVGLYPPGTLVRLANREIACITRLGRNGHVRFATSFLDARGRALSTPRERNLETRLYAMRNHLTPDPAWPAITWPLLWGYQEI